MNGDPCECCQQEAAVMDACGHALCDWCYDAVARVVDQLITRPEVIAALRRSEVLRTTEMWLAAHPGQTPLSAVEIVELAETGADVNALPTSGSEAS